MTLSQSNRALLEVQNFRISEFQSLERGEANFSNLRLSQICDTSLSPRFASGATGGDASGGRAGAPRPQPQQVIRRHRGRATAHHGVGRAPPRRGGRGFPACDGARRPPCTGGAAVTRRAPRGVHAHAETAATQRRGGRCGGCAAAAVGVRAPPERARAQAKAARGFYRWSATRARASRSAAAPSPARSGARW